MVPKYMVTDTDSAKDKLGRPPMETEGKKPLEEIVANMGRYAFNPEILLKPFNRKVKLWLFLTIIACLGVFFYYLWTADFISPALDMLHSDEVVVTAIVHGDDKATAVISGSVVHEGDVVNGYTVVKIQKEKVELEKNGRRLTKQVYK